MCTQLIIVCQFKKWVNFIFIFLQLTIAKVHSEKRIHSLGGIDYKSYETTEDSDKSGAPSTKVSIYLMQPEHIVSCLSWNHLKLQILSSYQPFYRFIQFYEIKWMIM